MTRGPAALLLATVLGVSPAMSDPTMPEPPDPALCRLGEESDAASQGGDQERALGGYARILEAMVEKKAIDPFLMAKLTLGQLLALLRAGKTPDAHATWISKPPTYSGYGIQFLEGGQVSSHDTITYMMVSGFLHSLSAGDTAAAAHAVNKTMDAVAGYALQEEPALAPQALSNWHHHLREVFEAEPFRGVPPPADRAALEARMAEFGRDLEIRRIEFPAPSPWRIAW